MSEIKRRTKSEEPRSEEAGGASPKRQTRVTLTKDVSSKYRKIMPKDQSDSKAGPKGKAPRRKPGEEGSAPPTRAPRASRPKGEESERFGADRERRPYAGGRKPAAAGTRPGRPRSAESDAYGADRERRPAAAGRKTFTEGSRPTARAGRPRSAESDRFGADRERRPAAAGRKTFTEGSRPTARTGRPRSAESDRFGADRERRPAAGGPRRQPAGGQRFEGRSLAGAAGAASRGPGPETALKAIINRELPEATKQVKGAQELILNSANEMLALTEVLEDIHQRLEEALNGVLDEHGHLKSLLTPLRDETAKARSVVIGLYEKMSFQDLAGQRLLKVEDFLAALGRVLGGLGKKPGPKPAYTKDSTKPARNTTGTKLKGPQDKGEGMGQSDIDHLLADL